MKAILLLAIAGFVLAVGFSVPFSEDDLKARNNKLKDTADELVDDLEPENLESDYDMDEEDEEDEEDGKDDFEDEDEDNGDRDEDEDEDEEDEDEVDDEDGGTAMERSSDPLFGRRRVRLRRVGRRIVRRIGRGVRRIGRGVRRIGRGVRRVGRRVRRIFRG